MRVGIIGLGNMGRGIAANLLEYAKSNGWDLFVFDINQAAMDALAANGAHAAGSIKEIATNSDVIFTSLPSAKEVGEVAYGREGLLENMPENAVWFETSTNDLGAWSKVRATAPDHLTLIDAPVTGGAEGAAAGMLTMLLGLDQPLSKELNELLGSFVAKPVVMGPAGAGYIAKLCQLHLNYLVAQGIGETLVLGAKGGLDLDTLSDVLSHSCAQSYVVDNYIPKVLDGSYDPSFTLGLAKKDMSLINGLSDHLDVKLPLAQDVFKAYQTAIERYGTDVPHLNIVKLIEDETGVKLRS